MISAEREIETRRRQSFIEILRGRIVRCYERRKDREPEEHDDNDYSSKCRPVAHQTPEEPRNCGRRKAN